MLTTPIYNESNLPPDFITKGMFVVESFNYPDSDADLDFDPMTNIHEVDPCLSLITEKNDFLTPPVEEDIFSFVHDNLNVTLISHSKSFYN